MSEDIKSTSEEALREGLKSGAAVVGALVERFFPQKAIKEVWNRQVKQRLLKSVSQYRRKPKYG